MFFLDLREARSALAGADHRAGRRAPRRLRRASCAAGTCRGSCCSDGTEPEALATPRTVTRRTARWSARRRRRARSPRPARVVLDPVGAHLEPGEILVAPSTDPGWTPLFLTAGALVMEMGGANSHGAVVAREYGIPAVVGVPGATALIETGEIVTVDGAAGQVLRD